MLFKQKTVKLKNGKECIFRSPVAEDAAGLNELLKTCAAETDFILPYPEECLDTTEQETAFIKGMNESDFSIMIVCLVDGKIAGNCEVNFRRRIKVRHRAIVSICIIGEYWNLGIGTAMFEEMIGIAKAHSITQLELEIIEGNARARALYEKMGFRVVSIRPDTVRLRDGTLLHEYFMVKEL